MSACTWLGHLWMCSLSLAPSLSSAEASKAFIVVFFSWKRDIEFICTAFVCLKHSACPRWGVPSKGWRVGGCTLPSHANLSVIKTVTHSQPELLPRFSFPFRLLRFVVLRFWCRLWWAWQQCANLKCLLLHVVVPTAAPSPKCRAALCSKCTQWSLKYFLSVFAADFQGYNN